MQEGRGYQKGARPTYCREPDAWRWCESCGNGNDGGSSGCETTPSIELLSPVPVRSALPRRRNGSSSGAGLQSASDGVAEKELSIDATDPRAANDAKPGRKSLLPLRPPPPPESDMLEYCESVDMGR